MNIYRKISMYTAWILLVLYGISLARALTLDIESLERKGAIVQSMMILYITPFPLFIYGLTSLTAKISVYRKLLMVIPISAVPIVVIISNPVISNLYGILAGIVVLSEGVLLWVEDK